MAVEVEVKNNNMAFLESINSLPDVHDVALIQYTGEYRN
jgi:hypothetical protein